MKPNCANSNEQGFSLIELAIVLIIVSLLLGGMMISLSAQYDQRNYNDTQKQMSEIIEALTGYAASHSATDGKPYLPCPDGNDDDGKENRAANPGACTSQEGRIPWADLGVGQQDAWNNRFRYRVAAAYSNSANGFTLSSVTTNSLQVCPSSACTTQLTSVDPKLAPAVIIVSHGKNGLGAFNNSGGQNVAPTSPDESANTDNDENFVSRAFSNVAGSEFDDIVSWLSPNILFARMVSAGRFSQ